MAEITTLLRQPDFSELRRTGEDEFSDLNGRFQGKTTDDLDLILRPNDQKVIV